MKKTIIVLTVLFFGINSSSFCQENKVNTKSVSNAEMDYDGVYVKDQSVFREILSNDASIANYVYGSGTPWNYPKVYFSFTKHHTIVNKPQHFILNGSYFTDDNMSSLVISPLKTTTPGTRFLYKGNNLYSEKDKIIYMPDFDTKDNIDKKLDYKKRKLGSNKYEVLITSPLESGKDYVFILKGKLWVFQIK